MPATHAFSASIPSGEEADAEAPLASTPSYSSAELGSSSLDDPSSLNWFDESWCTDWQQLFTESLGLKDLLLPRLTHDKCFASLSFLDRFTSNTGFLVSFDCCTALEREQIAAIAPQATETQSIKFDSIRGSRMTKDMRLTNSEWDDGLAIKSRDVALLLKEVTTLKTRGSAVTLEWSRSVEESCLGFFSPANVRKFLHFYWLIWHPNVNFVHYPSFDVSSTKSILIAAMVLIGALVSPDSKDKQAAETWLNCVEEMVFMDDFFVHDQLGMSQANPLASRNKIQALQAAYMVVLYQNWEGTDASKSRVRRYRYSTLISAARDLGIERAQHPKYYLLKRKEFNWANFILREELIRTFLWIFLLDTGFVIFNNLPPRMVVREMKMHLAMPEACFQASNSDECFEKLGEWTPSGSSYWKNTFASKFKSLGSKSYTATINPSLGPLNMFALASAIHSIIFQCQNFFVGDQPLKPVQNALDNWSEEWQRYTIWFSGSPPHVMVGTQNVQPEHQWKRVGFCRYAHEFWLLASLKYNRMTGHNETENASADPYLDHFDQTSMRQVNELIWGFQKIEI